MSKRSADGIQDHDINHSIIYNNSKLQKLEFDPKVLCEGISIENLNIVDYL